MKMDVGELVYLFGVCVEFSMLRAEVNSRRF
jgi:hypothetical protein